MPNFNDVICEHILSFPKKTWWINCRINMLLSVRECLVTDDWALVSNAYLNFIKSVWYYWYYWSWFSFASLRDEWSSCVGWTCLKYILIRNSLFQIICPHYWKSLSKYHTKLIQVVAHLTVMRFFPCCMDAYAWDACQYRPSEQFHCLGTHHLASKQFGQFFKLGFENNLTLIKSSCKSNHFQNDSSIS